MTNTIKRTTLALLIAGLMVGHAHALGLGEIVPLSRIGEPLRAEVPIIAAGNDSPETLCFSLGNPRDPEFPAVRNAKLRIVQRDREFRLQILGTKGVADPIMSISIRANCGADLQRDYIIMPEAPLMIASPEISPATKSSGVPPQASAKPPRTNHRIWDARAGETLESIADATTSNQEERQRMHRALRRANPELSPGETLPEGTPVRIPRLPPKAKPLPPPGNLPTSSPRNADVQPSKPQVPESAAEKTAPTGKTAGGPDRVLLGAAPEPQGTSRNQNTSLAGVVEMEQRMIQMESTLQQLRQEIEKMDATLASTGKVVEAGLQTREPAPSSMASSAPLTVTTPSQASGGSWLELLLSGILGGVLTVAMLHFLERRQMQARELEQLNRLPLRQPAQHEPSMQPGLASRPPQRPIPARNTEPQASADTQTTMDISYDDDASVLALADVMIEQGRLKGAASTLGAHIAEHDPDNIRIWSMLLDLYRRGDMRPEFEMLAGRIHEKFNVELASWEHSETPISGLRTLEDYPHIAEYLQRVWGTWVGLDYLRNLMHDNRAGKRLGFPLEVIEEIVLLIHIMEDAYDLGAQQR